MAFDDDVREPYDGEAALARLILPTAWDWQPPRLLDCWRCSAVTLTRESRCGRCGWREE